MDSATRIPLTAHPLLRAATRETHLGYLDSIVGQLLLAGPILNAEGQSVGSLLVVEAENRFGVQFRTAEIESLRSVGEFLALIAAKQARAAA